MSILAQYHGEQGGTHPGHLTWPGANGLPVLGPPNTLLKREELARLPKHKKFHARDFHLDKPEERKEYEQIVERIAVRWFKLVTKMPWRDPVTHEIRVYLEWIQEYSANNLSDRMA